MIEKNGDARGSTFVVNLIVKRSLNQTQAASDLPYQLTKGPSKCLNDWKILVVDDSEDNRTLMKVLLEREGAIVDLASGADEGIEKAHASNFDLVLMDIQMPNVDGYQALARLRQESYRKPIFALTAHTMKEERDRALAAGFSGHISKPINASALVDTLIAHARQWH
ncbi:MAG: response regulator [Bdellovibrionota bacterium]